MIEKKQNNQSYDVVGLGSPLLDIIVQVDEDTLVDLDFKKGGMHLVSHEQSKEILEGLSEKEKKIAPGGSTANTLAGLSALGNDVAFFGLVGDDTHGTLYREGTDHDGVDAQLSEHKDLATGHTITFITPDQERTFATHLGAAAHFQQEHVPADVIRKSKVLHIEAYQLEDERTRDALLYAMDIAKKSGVAITIDLSDPGLIERNLELFKKIVHKYINIVFVNEDEAYVFTGKKEEQALEEIVTSCDTVIVKLGERGSLIKSGDTIYRIAAHKIEAMNTNGAGDMYAAGILHGMIHKLPFEESGKIASHTAALAVGSEGARIDQKHLKALKQYHKK